MPTLEDRLVDLVTRIGQSVKAGLAVKADDSTVVHRSGTETIAGAKTFSSPPSVPSPTAAAHPVRSDDTRNSNARTPVPHAGSHATGQPDAITPGAIGAQPGSTALTQIAGLTGLSDGQLLRRVSGAWAAATLGKGDVGLGNVDNTADTAKPVSTAQQTALDAKLNTAAANAASGWLQLDASGMIPQSKLPAIAVVDFLGAVGSQSAMLALAGQRGDWCTRTDLGTDWQIIGDTPTQLSSWRERTYPGSPVSSVNGRTGTVTGLAEASALAGYVPTSRSVAAGTGLTGGGDLGANRTLAVSYGTTAGTAVEGNDTRVTGAEQTSRKDQAGGYAGLDSNGRIPVEDMPLTRSRVRNAGNVSGNVPWSAVGGNIVNFAAVGDCTFAGATNPTDGMDLRAVITASGGNRTIAFTTGGAVPIYPVGHIPVSVWVPSGLVLIADFIYSAAAGGWLLTSCDVERPVGDQGTCYAVSAAAQPVGSNSNPQVVVAFGTDIQTTALVVKNTSSPGHTFTLQRTGLWALWFSLLYAASVVSHKRGHLAQSGGGTGVPGIITGGSGYSPSASGQGSVFCSGIVPAIRLLAGTVLTVTAYQGTTSGGTADSLVSGSCSFGATFLGP